MVKPIISFQDPFSALPTDEDLHPPQDTDSGACLDSDAEDGPRIEMTPDQVEYGKTVPLKYQQLYFRAHTANSLRDAVDAKCREGNGYEDAASRTRECHIESCPLWSHRRVGSWRARRDDSFAAGRG